MPRSTLTQTATGATTVLQLLRQQPTLIPLLSIVCLVMMGIGVISPVLSLYGESFGVSVTEVGLTITLFGVARLLVNIPGGTLSQRWGRRPVLLVGLAGLALASLAAASTEQFRVFLFWRLIQGAGSGLYITSALAGVADLSTPQTRGRAMALYQAAVSVGTSLGPAFGGWIATQYGFRSPFIAFGFLSGGAMIVALLVLPETLVESKKHQRSSLRWTQELCPILASPGFVLIALISFSTFFTRTAAKLNLIPLTIHHRFDLGADVIGLLMTLATLINFISLPMVGAAIDRFGNKDVVLWSSMSCAISLGWIALAQTFLQFSAGLLLFSLGTSICIPATGAYLADVIPEDRYGPAMGIFRSISDAGFILGPLCVGPIVDDTPLGLAGGLVFNGVLTFCFSALFWAYGRKPHPPDMTQQNRSELI